MNLNVLRSFMSVALVFSLSACTSSKDVSLNSSVGKIDAAGLAGDTTIPAAEKAEKLARASEQLLTLQGFAYAQEVADLALSIDPENFRAQLVRALLAPIMAQKGFAVRIRPLAMQSEETYKSYVNEMAVLDQEVPNSTYKEFMLDGKEDIKSEADFQSYVDSVVNGFKVLREFAKNNKSKEITIRVSDAFHKAMVERRSQACEVVEKSDYIYEFSVVCPDFNSFMEVTLNRADFEVLQQTAGGLELWFSLINSYKLDGALKVVTDLKDSNEKGSEKMIESLLENLNFGILRDNQGFTKFKDLGSDFISAARWVLNNQNSLCPRGIENPKNRIGMLFNHGTCVDRSRSVEISKDLTKAADVIAGRLMRDVELGGQTTYAQDPQTGEWVKVTINGFVTDLKPMAIFENPISDLRAVRPTRYNACGKVVSIADATLGGVFVKSDYNDYLAKTEKCE